MSPRKSGFEETAKARSESTPYQPMAFPSPNHSGGQSKFALRFCKSFEACPAIVLCEINERVSGIIKMELFVDNLRV
jgi:hypothetical protein